MHISKQKVKDQFSKASSTYENSACTQYAMAKTLNSLLDAKSYQEVLEIGCGTGALSDLFASSHDFKSLVLNDISDSMLAVCWEKFRHDDRIAYLQADAENLHDIIDSKYSLIISNACFQWFKDLKQVLISLKDLLEDDGQILFSTFIEGNFLELKNTAGVSLHYLSEDCLTECLLDSGLDFEISVHQMHEYFSDAKAMLKSLKETGVTGLSNSVWTKGRLLKFIKDYESLYKDEKGVRLTWRYAFVKGRKIS